MVDCENDYYSYHMIIIYNNSVDGLVFLTGSNCRGQIGCGGCPECDDMGGHGDHLFPTQISLPGPAVECGMG